MIRNRNGPLLPRRLLIYVTLRGRSQRSYKSIRATFAHSRVGQVEAPRLPSAVGTIARLEGSER